jgi:hypothetical protein
MMRIKCKTDEGGSGSAIKLDTRVPAHDSIFTCCHQHVADYNTLAFMAPMVVDVVAPALLVAP